MLADRAVYGSISLLYGKLKVRTIFPDEKDGRTGLVKERKSERPLWLSEDEAMGLLDLAMIVPSELTPDQRAAVGKLSEFCRHFLRNPEEAAHSTLPAAPPLSASLVA